MRGATECAKRVKQLFSSLRSRLGKVGHPPATEPITQLILGILSRDTPESKASEGLERLRGMVVDYNELRVIPPIELAGILGDFPDARLKCEDISRALNGVFALEHGTSLERLADLPKKEVVALLEKIDGLEAYTRARIRLYGLGHHAIPLDEAMWATARAEGIVDPRCPLPEAQQFLERQVSEDDTLEFAALLKRHAWNEMGAAVKRGEVERILSVPPDRTSRNMLQMVMPSAGVPMVDETGDEAEAEAELLPEPELDEAEGKHATARRSAKAGRPAPAAKTASAKEKKPKARGDSVKAAGGSKGDGAVARKRAPRESAAARGTHKTAKGASGVRTRKAARKARSA